MKIHFEKTINEQARKSLREVLGVPHAEDGKIFLFHGEVIKSRSELGTIARASGQDMHVVSFPVAGETVELGDGTRHERSQGRWRKL
jgi:hypothetical protein